jgi:hypothetical protein
MNTSLKYNRTFHFPFSEGASNDDKIACSIDSVLNTEIIITEKLDGSNTSLEANGCFARTHSGPPTHKSFDGLKALHSSVKYKIPENIQLFGEWCYAKHSIEYNELPGYFLLFNVRSLINDKLIWLSWDEVLLWAEEINVPTVPVLFRGTVSSGKNLENMIKSFMIEPSLCGGIREGVVVRVQRELNNDEFSSCVLKCVRKDHVTTSTHWTQQAIVMNKLKVDSLI